jgi:acyl carrier protein
MKKDDLFNYVKTTLVEDFGIDESKIVPEARFLEDLDLDSIDAVDLVVQLRNTHNIELGPDDFKNMVTIGDLVDILDRLAAQAGK